MRKHFLILFLLSFSASVLAAGPEPQQVAADSSTLVEQGKFTLHKFEQPIGQETFEIRRDGDSLTVKVDFKFVDRGSPVPLAVTFRSAQDLTPQSFEIKGQTARSASIDEAVTINNGSVH